MTKERVVKIALAQSSLTGLQQLSFGSLAKASGLSKSGLFAHFSSKEDLQCEVLDHAIEKFAEKVIAKSARKEPGLDQLRVLFVGFLDWIKGDSELPGCPFITYVQEYDDQEGVVRDKLVSSQSAWRQLLTENFRLAQQSGEVSRKAPADQLSFEFIGAALSYQTSLKLLGDGRARKMAQRAFEHIIQHSEDG